MVAQATWAVLHSVVNNASIKTGLTCLIAVVGIARTVNSLRKLIWKPSSLPRVPETYNAHPFARLSSVYSGNR